MIKQFHHKDFLPIKKLCAKKANSNKTISLIIPTLNEVSTVGQIVAITRNELVAAAPLLDEIIVMDGGSDDGTVARAREAGATVYNAQEIGDKDIPPGKGTALWKSLHIARGDIIVCIDADIKNFDIRFVYGLIAPLLYDSSLSFIKAFYKRPIVVDDIILHNYGGRVTEILVRPLLSAFYPELAQFFQPLSGEYSFRKDVAATIPFFSGYGLEIGLLLDVYKLRGISSFAQVDMDIRCHRNRSVTDLGKMAFAILQVFLKRLQGDHKAVFPHAYHAHMKSFGLNGWHNDVILQGELPSVFSKKGEKQ